MATQEMDADTSAVWHLLLDSGKATADQLQDVYDEHDRTGKAFTTVLYNYGIVSEDELLALMAEQLGTEVTNVKEANPSRELVNKVGSSIARMYGVVPIKEEDGVVYIAAKDPLNYRMIDELNYVLGQECSVLVGRPADVDHALDVFYPQEVETVENVLGELQQSDLGREMEEEEEDVKALEEMAENAPIVRLVDVILYQAIKDQASDIHFEPFEDEFRIRYRIDGALYEMSPPPKHLAVPVISRVKVLSGLNIAERRHPQDGRIELRIAGKPIDLRVSTLPTQYGESVVLRVLDRSVVSLDLDKIGLPADTIKTVRELIARPNGILIVTGPTGCGKTTTLYSCLSEINTVQDKILTTEEPVEYDIEGVMQVQVRDEVGMTFANGLRAFLRQDPDKMMVGEIRDLETAQMAVQSSLTGHFVLSTLHTNDAPGAITRLIEMGVEPFLLSSTITAVLGQRLIRCICKNCVAAYDPEDSELEALGLSRDELGDHQFYYGQGCEKCYHTGYKGRTGIFECFNMSNDLQQLVTKSRPTLELRHKAIEEGMRTMKEHAVEKIMAGVTTAEEVLKYL